MQQQYQTNTGIVMMHTSVETASISDITETSQKNESAPVLMAIDSVYEGRGKDVMIIDDVYRSYDFDESGKGIAKWLFKLKDEDEVLVVDTSKKD